jgi:hypothetical protein
MKTRPVGDQYFRSLELTDYNPANLFSEKSLDFLELEGMKYVVLQLLKIRFARLSMVFSCTEHIMQNLTFLFLESGFGYRHVTITRYGQDIADQVLTKGGYCESTNNVHSLLEDWQCLHMPCGCASSTSGAMMISQRIFLVRYPEECCKWNLLDKLVNTPEYIRIDRMLAPFSCENRHLCGLRFWVSSSSCC